MTLGRLFRTARYLTPEQLLFSIVRRARHSRWARRPAVARARIGKAAAQLPRIDPQQPRLQQIAAQVALLQRTIHPQPIAELRAGRLGIFGQDMRIDPTMDWRCEMGEGNSPLRRLTLAYFGWAVPLLADGKTEDLQRILAALDRLDDVPWSEPGVFRDIWNPYTASHRLINLLTGLHLYGRSGGPADIHLDRILEHVRFCAALVTADLERDIQANHLLKNWTALAIYAAATEVPDKAFAGLANGVRRSVAQLVLVDGGHAERSPMYHALGLMDVDAIIKSGAVPTLAVELDDASARLRAALSILTHPDGDIALFNDAWLGGAPPPGMLQIQPPGPGRHILPTTGYTRLDGVNDVVVFDAGACALDCQPGHAHADFLSFELSVARTRFVVDPGTATYTAGPLRHQVRSAASHNGPHVVGHEPLELWQSFRVGRRARAGFLQECGLSEVTPLWCAGWQDGYQGGGVGVRRWLGLWPHQALVILDLWTGLGARTGCSRLLIPEPWQAVTRDGALSFVASGAVQVRPILGEIGPVQQAPWWPRYGTEARASAIELQPHKNGPVHVAALLIAWGTPPENLSRAMLERLARTLTAAPM